MKSDANSKSTVGRRGLLAGLATGLGVAAAAAGTRKASAEGTVPAAPASTGPILYRRTAEADRYYRTMD